MKQEGYTFIELLLVITIFSVILTVLASTFVLFSNMHSRQVVTQHLINDARYMMEKMVRHVRSSQIDYEYYAEQDLTKPQKSLALFQKDTTTRFYLSLNCKQNVSQCLEIETDAQSGTLSSDDIVVKDVNFYIVPKASPYEINNGFYKENIQPHVVMSMVLQSAHSPDITFKLQTTASSNIYKR